VLGVLLMTVCITCRARKTSPTRARISAFFRASSSSVARSRSAKAAIQFAKRLPWRLPVRDSGRAAQARDRSSWSDDRGRQSIAGGGAWPAETYVELPIEAVGSYADNPRQSVVTGPSNPSRDRGTTGTVRRSGCPCARLRPAIDVSVAHRLYAPTRE
jgi:hypothetical protein